MSGDLCSLQICMLIYSFRLLEPLVALPALAGRHGELLPKRLVDSLHSLGQCPALGWPNRRLGSRAGRLADQFGTPSTPSRGTTTTSTGAAGDKVPRVVGQDPIEGGEPHDGGFFALLVRVWVLSSVAAHLDLGQHQHDQPQGREDSQLGQDEGQEDEGVPALVVCYAEEGELEYVEGRRQDGEEGQRPDLLGAADLVLFYGGVAGSDGEGVGELGDEEVEEEIDGGG
mmetsp:Transcript_17707/g.30492  ORF Transcript_17707/g.30492 Transcript_17707/m.30492 type:complete len:228 (+) Transcript_17707:438-1121(+)